MGESTAAKAVRKLTGMWWPDADSDKLRKVADAWEAMATALDNVTVPTNQAAAAIVANNHGPAIDAFGTFWGQYYGGKDTAGKGKGWLPETADACRALAKALREFADAVDKAIKKLEEEAAIVGGTLIAGTALAFFTLGISEGAALTASAGIVAAAATLGVTVSETIALIAATVLVGAAFGAVEAITVDLAVAQPIRVEFFDDGGYSLQEAIDSGKTGELMGAAGGGLGAGGRAVANAAERAESASVALAGLAKVANAADTLPGRMVTGAGLSYGYDAAFKTGPVMPLDLILGAVGAAAAPGSGPPKRRPSFSGAEANGFSRKPDGAPEPWVSESGSPYVHDPNSSEPINIKAVKMYEDYRARTDDVAEVATETKIDPRIVDVAKNNLMVNRHDVQVGPGEENVMKDVYFEPEWEIARRWNAAVKGIPGPSDTIDILRTVIAHEYVEAKLFEAGLPYLPSHPDCWEDGGRPIPHPEHFSAHQMAPNSFNKLDFSSDTIVSSLWIWRKYGIEVPPVPIADDLSNLDVLVDAIKSHIRAKGHDLK
ncbi:hypothetical protein ACFVXG_23155 [Kitasatospora sp. NPDC058162]|uniref:WXG100-like domain-containing protein n=1 Tax=Kitasatospora sp. NPDC058162 TaxID=3346362 RepID=UPI0036D76FC6